MYGLGDLLTQWCSEKSPCKNSGTTQGNNIFEQLYKRDFSTYSTEGKGQEQIFQYMFIGFFSSTL